jgi:hypothetical protein
MSRFADPTAVDSFDVACPCPGTPHEQDTITYRLELGAGEVDSAGTFGWQRGLAMAGTAYYDAAAAMSMLIRICVVRWTFVDAQGAPLDVTVRSADLLPEAIREALREKVNAAQAWENTPVPKASGEDSPSGTRAKASRTPRTRKPD